MSSLAMDNFEVKVVAWNPEWARERNYLFEALQLAFADNKSGATHYTATPSKITNVRGRAELDTAARLTFYWHANSKGTPLPFKLDAKGAAEWAGRWLSEAEYGPQPDHDGDNSKGFTVATLRHGADYSICYVEPSWACHGK